MSRATENKLQASPRLENIANGSHRQSFRRKAADVLETVRQKSQANGLYRVLNSKDFRQLLEKPDDIDGFFSSFTLTPGDFAEEFKKGHANLEIRSPRPFLAVLEKAVKRTAKKKWHTSSDQLPIQETAAPPQWFPAGRREVFAYHFRTDDPSKYCRKTKEVRRKLSGGWALGIQLEVDGMCMFLPVQKKSKDAQENEDGPASSAEVGTLLHQARHLRTPTKCQVLHAENELSSGKFLNHALEMLRMHMSIQREFTTRKGSSSNTENPPVFGESRQTADQVHASHISAQGPIASLTISVSEQQARTLPINTVLVSEEVGRQNIVREEEIHSVAARVVEQRHLYLSTGLY
ncbi:hypothetical protein DIPPA_70174 [Diplonema papillatum]|nr:hypothetical protein DIPPA_70174 [Diplonema papillatum]